MKKIYIFTAVLALLTLSLNAQLQAKKKAVVKQQATADKVDTRPDGKGPNRANRDLSVTVGDNSSYTGYVPVYGTWFDSDAGQRNQMIYSSDLLGLPVGAQITSLKFYARGTLGFHSAPVRLSIGHTTAVSFTSLSFVSSSDLKQVATVTPTTSMTELNFTFSQAFTYNGGNLLIQIDSDKGEYGSTDFYANEQSDYVGIIAYQGYSDNGLTIQDRTQYLPMATFTYIAGTNPLITASNSNLTFKTAPGEPASQTVTIAGYNLTDDITATVRGDSEFSVSPTTLGTNGGNLTVTYSPTATGSHSATLTLSSTGAEDVNITLNGSCVQEKTICDGGDQSNYLPLYGYYYDAKQVNQMIYPADKLTSLVGTKITSMTFYSPHIYFYNGKFTVKVGTTSQTSFSSIARNTADLTATVASDLSATAGGTELTITFDAPFEYNGGNLIVDFEETATGSWGSNQTYFYGENQSTNTSFNTQGSSLNNGVYTGTGSGLRSFLPKVTFTFEDNEPRHDLSVALSAPASVVGGNTATVTATVTNTGNQTETGYTVTITDGTNNLLNQTATEPLAPGATATFTAEYNTTEAQVGNTVNFTANVACTDDADATNNSATASMQIITMPAPENVAATTSGNNATMTWTAPSTLPMLPGTMTWDFEEETDFNAFTTIDADGDGYNWTWHYNGVTDDGNLTGHDGSNGVVYSESYHNTGSNSGVALTPSNWLISPEVTLGGTLTLWACGQDEGYPAEKLGVYVCVGSYNDSTSFVRVDADVTTTSEMTQYSFNLSQYEGQQGYFAIVHHNVTDQFILNIDDISYETLVPTAPVSYNIYLDGELMGNVAADAALTYNFSNLASGGHTASVSAVYPGGIESAAVPAEFTILPTPNAPTVSSNDGTTSTTITITPDANTDGQLVYYVDYNGSQTQDLTFPRGANDYTVEVHAYTTATSNYNQSPEAVVTVTIPALPKTDMPVITSEQVGDYLVITATGNGIVTLNIPGYPEAQGNGSASISVPCGVVSSTVTATATAQEDGKQKSDPREQTITIPAGEGWNEMTGTYEDDDDLLSLEVKVGNDTIDIMMVDQFVASTYSNEHSDGYTYTMQETVNDVDWFSNPAPIPVFKTSSTLQGLYTQTQVDNDTLMQYRANVLNTEIDYTVKPDPLVMYYDLYRGGKNEVYPVVDPGTEISRLQQFSDEANAQYFYYETHQSGIAPRYDHVGEQLVERIDTGYVDGIAGDEIAYVPVIWVPGLSTARGDGKNNSYGSDIKYNELGGVNISVEGYKNDENNTTGQWVYQDGSADGITYCVYSPVITLNGIMPEIEEAHDGETYQYVPYMYRVWCTYPSAHNFTFRANPDGRKHLVDAGPITAPFLIGEATAEDSVWHNNGEEVVFGRALASGEEQQPWSFGVPKTEDSQNVKFIARFYYKKVVTDSANSASGLRGNRDGEEAFAIAENGGDGHGILTGIDELWNNVVYVVSKTYVNALGMQSDKPFDGLNIVVTRFSDGTTTTTKVVR